MKKVIFQLIISLLAFNSITAQVKEFGLFFGGAYYRGELNKSHFGQTDLSLGAIFKKDFPNDRVSLRFQLMYNRVQGDDFKSGVVQQINRNLSFKSDVIELGPVMEIDFFPFHPGQNNAALAAFGTPYFFGGINYMRMNPKALYNGEWMSYARNGRSGYFTNFTKEIFIKSNCYSIWYWY